jgi:hypothetical protein
MKLSAIATAAAIVIFVAGCAQRNTVIPSSPAVQNAASTAPAFTVSGVYKGTIVEQEGTSSRAGTVVITIAESGRKISGSFDVTFSGKTDDLTISGTVKSQKKSKAKIAFEISDPKGRYAAATATVGAKRLKGRATVPATSSKPAVHLTFKTKRTK